MPNVVVRARAYPCGGGRKPSTCPRWPGAEEVGDGLDNDCDGSTDNSALTPAVAMLSLLGNTLSQEAVDGASGYDVVAGDPIGLAEPKQQWDRPVFLRKSVCPLFWFSFSGKIGLFPVMVRPLLE